MNNQDAFLRVENLRVEYVSGGKTVHAVNDVSFDLERGKTLGLVGETAPEKPPLPKRSCGSCRMPRRKLPAER